MPSSPQASGSELNLFVWPYDLPCLLGEVLGEEPARSGVLRRVLGKVVGRVLGKVLALLSPVLKEEGKHFPKHLPEHSTEHFPEHPTSGRLFPKHLPEHFLRFGWKKSPKMSSRGLSAPGPKKLKTGSKKSQNRLFFNYFDSFSTPFSTFWAPGPRGLGNSFSDSFSNSGPGRPKVTPVRGQKF